MTRTTKALIASAAIAGLISGSAMRAYAGPDSGKAAGKASSIEKMGCSGKDGCKSKGDCKGKNECKGKGGCKAGDNGCKGKNSCKGKGGWNCKDAERAWKQMAGVAAA